MNFCSRIYNQSAIDYFSAEGKRNRHHIQRISGDAKPSPSKSGDLKASTKDWVAKSFYSSPTIVAAAKKSAPIITTDDQTKPPAKNITDYRDETEKIPAKNIPDYRGEPQIYFDQSVINSNAEKFKFCLVGKFKRSRPTLEKIREWVAKEWKPKGEWSVTLLDRTHVFFRLDNEADMVRIWPRNRWFIRGHLMKIFKWAPTFRPSDGEPSSSAVWISLPLLPVVFFQQELLYSIASLVGTVIAMDGPTRNLSRTNLARVCVEVDLLIELPNRVWIAAGEGGFWQDIRFEKLPSYCTHCREQGHSLRICKFNKHDATSCVSQENSSSEKEHVGAEVSSQPSNKHCSFVEENKKEQSEKPESSGECSNVLKTTQTHSASGPNKTSRRGNSRSWHTDVLLGMRRKQTHERSGIGVLDKVEESMGIESEEIVSAKETHSKGKGLLDEERETEAESEEDVGGLAKKDVEIYCPNKQKQETQEFIEFMKNRAEKRSLENRSHPNRTNFLLNKTIIFWKKKSKKVFVEENGGSDLCSHNTEITMSSEIHSSSLCSSMAVDNCRQFSLSEIKNATKNFSRIRMIGEGGFGIVYRGVIDGRTTVAIKRGSISSFQGMSEFLTELMFSKIRHRHLAFLIGFCNENNERILVYEFVARGNLGDHLYNKNIPHLSWKQRLQICIGAARGLDYLHRSEIIYRDVKTSNILIDEKWDSKISDFGLCKRGPSLDQTHVSTRVMGTYGYAAPEYVQTGRLSYKSDVYSFGVVLYEVLCGRRPFDRNLPKNQVNLLDWALQHQRKRNLKVIVDPSLNSQINPNVLKKFGELAKRCVSSAVVDRPGMGDVLRDLEFVLQLQESSFGPGGNNNSSSLIKGSNLGSIVQNWEAVFGAESTPSKDSTVST